MLSGRREARRMNVGLAASAVLLLAVLGCGPNTKPGGDSPTPSGGAPATADLTGDIRIDGSSTVYLISAKAAEDFSEVAPRVKTSVVFTGTGTGFKRLAVGEIDIANASRAITESEIAKCQEAGVEYVEFQIAFDGIAVIVHKENDWVDCISVEQLKKIWEANSTVKTWADVDPAWPAEPIKLYGPGNESGTFDYFTEAINGKAKSGRPDYAASEDDNVLVTGVSGDKYALGYFGFAYYKDNAESIKLLGVKSDGDCVQPSVETVLNGTYTPLARPLFIYVNKASLKRPEVAAFVKFYLQEAEKIAAAVNYVPTPHDVISADQKKLDDILAEPK